MLPTYSACLSGRMRESIVLCSWRGLAGVPPPCLSPAVACGLRAGGAWKQGFEVGPYAAAWGGQWHRMQDTNMLLGCIAFIDESYHIVHILLDRSPPSSLLPFSTPR